MYRLRKRLWSQNFFFNRELISKLIRGSPITSSDTVLEIGVGSGIVTRQLAKVAKKVIAVEIDPHLASRLTNTRNVDVVCQNILDYTLPASPYKVFANIPFSTTNDIIRKLIQATNPPYDCYLVVQRQAARKFVTHPTSNTMAALLYYPWWEIQVVYRFTRLDFRPAPKVDSVLLRLKPRLHPLIPRHLKPSYFDFVAHSFVHNPRSKFVLPGLWLSRFQHYKHRHFSGSYAKLVYEQNHLKKIHRTRTDPH